ncbi:MAG: hypothetical protein L0Y66_14155 [Myxococcaceae bacterium]|nr:hypothetical protein [Myxococcaceae bacterium]MCI0673625.1 hypothetical protein [Myxococcaceae bacterium]
MQHPDASTPLAPLLTELERMDQVLDESVVAVAARSSAEEGTTFTVRLPRRSAWRMRP